MILFAKKRYAGYKYEKYGGEPVLEGKGIETIRRDGIEATQKIMTKVFMELFETKNLSSVRVSQPCISTLAHSLHAVILGVLAEDMVEDTQGPCELQRLRVRERSSTWKIP